MTVAGPVSPYVPSISQRDVHREQPHTSRPSDKNANLALYRFLHSQETINEETLQEGARLWPVASRVEIHKTATNKISLPPDFLSKLPSLFPKMRELSLNSRQRSDFVFDMGDKAFMAALPTLAPVLTAIELESCTSLTKRSFTALFEACTQLQRADINSNHLNNDHLRQALGIKTLRDLRVSGKNAIDDKGLEILSEQGAHLHIWVSNLC